MRNIKYLMIFIIGVILTIGISYAYKLNANDVTYDKKTTTLESNTVSGAIDELGVLATTSMSELKTKLDTLELKIDTLMNGGLSSDLQLLAGNIGITGSQTFDCTKLKNYQNLTVDNFLLDVVSVSYRAYGRNGNVASNQDQSQHNGIITKSYDAENGILTVSTSETHGTVNIGSSYYGIFDSYAIVNIKYIP